MPASVKNQHPLFARKRFEWRSVSDAMAGSDQVKRRNILYLPMPSGFEVDDTAASVTGRGRPQGAAARQLTAEGIDLNEAPFYHPNRAYMGYLQRSRFPELVSNTHRGLMGVASSRDPMINLPPRMADLENRCTRDGKSLVNFFYQALAAALEHGRPTIVVDIDTDTNSPVFTLYDATHFINWRYLYRGEYGLAVFSETKTEQASSDEFEHEQIEYTYVYSYGVEEGETAENQPLYPIVRKYRESELVATVRPTLQGQFFERLPIVCIDAAGGLNCDPGPSPLSGVSEIAYTIYRKDADQAQAEYMTCNPQLFITGVDSETPVPVMHGSTVALLLANPQSNAAYTKTDTAGLRYVSEGKEALFKEAALQGAQLLTPSGKAESEETVMQRKGSQSATLAQVVNNVGEGLQRALEIAASIMGASPDAVEFEPNTEFADHNLSWRVLTGLTTLWQAGGYSLESLIAVIEKAGLVEGTVEDELSRLMGEGPNGMPSTPEAGPPDLDSDDDDS